MRGRLAPLLLLLALLTACSPPAEPVPMETSPEPSAPPKVQVWTDWSQLAPREKPEEIGSRWYPDRTEELIPREDYGTLIPFAGAKVSGEWAEGYLYGLMTTDGTVVVDPVYSGAYVMTSYDGSTGRVDAFPAYVLTRATGERDEWGEPVAECTYAGTDGSWVIGPFRSAQFSASPDRVLIQGDGWWELRNREGTLIRLYTDEELGQAERSWAAIQWCGGKVSLEFYVEDAEADERIVVDGETGEIEHWTMSQWEDWQSSLANDDSSWYNIYTEGETTVIELGDQRYVLPWKAPEGESPWVENDLVLFGGAYGPVYRLDGTRIVPEGTYWYTNFLWDRLLWSDGNYPLYGLTEDGAGHILDREGREVFEIPPECNYEGVWDGIIGLPEENAMAYYDLSDGSCVFRTFFYGDGE